MNKRRGWGRDVVDLQAQGERLITVPLAWMDAAEPDPFYLVSAGRSYFRIEDLVLLADLLERMKS